MLPSHIEEDVASHAGIPQAEQDFNAGVQFLRARQGPVLCENLLMCYEAGKPPEYDLFVMDQLAKSGKVAEAAILQLLDQHRFSVVELDIAGNEAIAVAPRFRTSAAFMDRLLKNYKVEGRTASFAVFTPQ